MMHAAPRNDGSGPEWIQPAVEQEGIGRYAQTLRERWWVVALCLLLTTGAAIAYVAASPKSYEAEADLLITPVPAEAESLVRLGLPSRSADPLRDVQTSARLVTTHEVATRAQDALTGVPEASGSATDLLEKIESEPVAESNLVAVTATAGDPDDAADIANAVVDALIVQRTKELRTRVNGQLDRINARLVEDPDSAQLNRRASELTILAAETDPTLQVASRAVPPDTPVAPRPVLSIAGGILAGLVLGIALAFIYQALDPTLRREDQLRRLYRLPILTRVPREARRVKQPLAAASLSPAGAEAYRTLRGTLSFSAASAAADGGGRAILVTGSSPSEGKTTTAINLASALAATGRSVILIDADLRRPAIGKALNLTPTEGVVSVLVGNVEIRDALATTSAFGQNMGVLLADYEGDWASELFALPAGRQLVDEARQLAEFVIIDSPPLADVVDALPLAEYVDQVLVVARLGTTRLSKLSRLGELLAEIGVRPVGFVLVGTARPNRGDYQYYGQKDRSLVRTDPKDPRPRVRA